MAETHGLSNGVDHGLRLRAALVDLTGQLNIRRSEETASVLTGHVWFADCDSLFSHLVSPNTKQDDSERLAIDLSALKQLGASQRLRRTRRWFHGRLSSMERHIHNAIWLFDTNHVT